MTSNRIGRADVQKLLTAIKQNPGSLGQIGSLPSAKVHSIQNKDDQLFLISHIALGGSRDWLLQRIYIPDATEWDNGLKCATQWIDFRGHISYPELDEIIGDVNACIAAAAIAAALTVYFTSGASMAVASQIFENLVVECLKAKGIKLLENFSAWVTADLHQGAWHWCA